jgi:hypothetical protein
MSKISSLVLPNRTKRLVFISSLTARFRGSNSVDKETLHKLNQMMKLCANEKAMELPVLFGSAIWQGKTSVEICNGDVCKTEITSTNVKDMVANVVTVMPKCLKYGNDGQMEKDVEQFLLNSKVLIAH